MKCLIFDSGPLINFSMNGLLYILEKLKKEFNGDFLITKEVKKEIIDYPLTVKRFELGALRLEKLFKSGIIKHAELSKNEVDGLRVIRDELMNSANNTYKANKKYLHLIDKGEAAAFALAEIMKKKGLNTFIVIDERTARMIVENPENLRKLLEKKFHTSVRANKENYNKFNSYKVIRSTELIYIANNKKLIELDDKRAYEAILYGLKFNGTSISEDEIKELVGID